MSAPADKKSAPTITASAGAVAGLGAQPQSKVKPVQIWAFIGGAVLLLQLYVWIRWITGPYFQHVSAGPTEPPLFMKVFLVANTFVLLGGLPVGVWWFIVRPWRRDRRITLDGMLLVSLSLMFFQDPFLNYVNVWCTYNAAQFNRGSWTPYVPGWLSPDSPGHQVAEPLLSNAPGYGYGLVLVTIVGCWVMRKAKSRWPNMSNLRLIGITFVFTFLVDVVMEGCLLLPTGIFIYPGAIRSLSVNAGHYYQWPVYEGVLWGGVQAGLCCLRFFTDDRGRTVVERGLDQVRGGAARQQFVRFLAIFAAVSSMFFLLYNVPVQWFSMHGDPWPADVLKRSYFTSSLCGDGTDRPCPDPTLPMPTRRSGYINPDGQLVLPKGVGLPTVVPLQRGN